MKETSKTQKTFPPLKKLKEIRVESRTVDITDEGKSLGLHGITDPGFFAFYIKEENKVFEKQEGENSPVTQINETKYTIALCYSRTELDEKEDFIQATRTNSVELNKEEFKSLLKEIRRVLRQEIPSKLQSNKEIPEVIKKVVVNQKTENIHLSDSLTLTKKYSTKESCNSEMILILQSEDILYQIKDSSQGQRIELDTNAVELLLRGMTQMYNGFPENN